MHNKIGGCMQEEIEEKLEILKEIYIDLLELSSRARRAGSFAFLLAGDLILQCLHNEMKDLRDKGRELENE